LTLHLARAVNSANPANPIKPFKEASSETVNISKDAAAEFHEASETGVSGAEASQERIVSRRAVIHTVDISPAYSQHAEGIVRGFRQGMYSANVEFHVANVSEWINEQFQMRKVNDLKDHKSSFLSHAILDLPGSHNHIAQVASALHADGILVVFNPSLTQILDCVKVILAEGIPLWLDKVVELGAGATGGREWDVRTVQPRAFIKAEKIRKEAELAAEIVTEAPDHCPNNARTSTTRDEEQAQASDRSGTGWEMICRPKVGGRVVGGGFLGVWRKMAVVTK